MRIPAGHFLHGTAGHPLASLCQQANTVGLINAVGNSVHHPSPPGRTSGGCACSSVAVSPWRSSAGQPPSASLAPATPAPPAPPAAWHAGGGGGGGTAAAAAGAGEGAGGVSSSCASAAADAASRLVNSGSLLPWVAWRVATMMRAGAARMCQGGQAGKDHQHFNRWYNTTRALALHRTRHSAACNTPTHGLPVQDPRAPGIIEHYVHSINQLNDQHAHARSSCRCTCAATAGRCMGARQ